MLLPIFLATGTTLGALSADVDLLERALRTLHPGLERYREVDLDRSLSVLRAELDGPRTRREVTLALMRFTASLRCSHTYVNPLNQAAPVQAEMLDGRDRVPFAFRIDGRRIVVTGDATERGALPPGTEILAIDGRPVPEVLDALKPLARGDGANDAKRWYDLEVRGTGGGETFDIAYALTYAPEGAFRLRVRRAGTDAAAEETVAAVTRQERAARLGRSPDRAWTLRALDEQAVVLRLGTFSTWSMKGDWRARLAELFAEVGARRPSLLVLDVRGNEGGNPEVVDELARHLFRKPVTVDVPQEQVRYARIAPELGAHLSSWSDEFRDVSASLWPLGSGGYERRAAGKVALPHSADAFDGRVVLLVDGANSSATFRLAEVLAGTRRARLVGQPTGGNRRGTNGGLIAFLKLPASGLVVDLPLVGYFPAVPAEDAGIVPDVPVPTLADEAAWLAAAR